MFKIGILGTGNVGTGVLEILEKHSLNKKKFELSGVFSRTKKDLGNVKWFKSSDELVENSDIVIECIGGTDLAYSFISNALSQKKHVITANKMLIATHGDELSKLADENGVYLLFEASVCGGMPVLNTIKNLLQFDKMVEVSGVLNGTCNYIPWIMDVENISFDQALKKAQNLGYAESDPELDISGTDALHKAMILHKMCFGFFSNDITLRGIKNISLQNILDAKTRNARLKLICHIAKGKIIVSPAEVLPDDKLHYLKANLNGINLRLENTGPLYIEGFGAGKFPTSSSVILDLMGIINKTAINHFGNL